MSSLKQESKYALSLSSRVWKKVVGKAANADIMKLLLSSKLGEFIDNFLHILLTFYSSKVSEKIVKRTLRLVTKIAVLLRIDSQKTQPEVDVLQAVIHIESRLRHLALVLSSFKMLQYSYDYEFLRILLLSVKETASDIVEQYLSSDSTEKLNFVFEHLTRRDFLDKLFDQTTPETMAKVDKLCEQLDNLLTEDEIL